MRTRLRFFSNPIIVKELRSRMRGPRPFITVTMMLILLGGVTYGVYRIAITTLSMYSGTPISPQIGQSLFIMLSFLLLMVICILTPAVTAGSISGEREQLTYEMLLSTPLPPGKILWGKLFSSLTYIFLLIFSAIPIASLIFVFGGVSLREMIKSFIILIIVTITLGILGVFMSSLLQRSSRATVLSYIIIAVILVGTIVIYAGIAVIQQGLPPRWIIAINPISALASALSNSTTPYNSVLGFIPLLGVDLNMIGGDTVSFNSIPRPLYHFSLPLYGFFSIVLYILATRLVLPTNRWKITRRDVLYYLSAIFSLCAIVLGGFLMTTKNYEQSINTSGQIFPFQDARMIEPAIPQAVEVAVEEIPKGTILESISSFSVEELTKIYSLAIQDSILTIETEQGLNFQTIYLIQSVIKSEGNESYYYFLPSPVQLAISDHLEVLSKEILWVEYIEDITNKPEILANSNFLAIALSDARENDDGFVNVHLTIYPNGILETQTIYTIQFLENKWTINSTERVYDAANND